MPEIQVPELARKLARRFGITGEAPASFLAPEIVPVAVVADLVTPNEEDSGYERLCIGTTSLGPTAANYSHVQLYNPAASGLIIYADLVVATRGAAGRLRIHEFDTAATNNTSTKGFRDKRLSGAPVGQIRYENNVGFRGDLHGSADAPTADSVIIPLDYVLPAGAGILLVPNAVNVQCACTFYWRERQLLPSE